MKYTAQVQSQTAIQEVMQAVTILNISVANINKSIQILESTGVLQLFQKQNLVNALQSGNANSMNINLINTALDAMKQISQTILNINNAMNILKTNDAAAKSINVDYNTILTSMVQSVQSGDYQSFSNMISGYQANLKGTSGTVGS